MSGGHGKCVEVLHVIGDTLSQLGKAPMRPNLGPPTIATHNNKIENVNDITEEIDNDNGSSLVEATNNLEINNDRLSETGSPCEEDSKVEEYQEAEQTTVDEPETAVEIAIDPVKEMDNLLEYCFLKACKTSIKLNDLPILSSNFSKNHLLAACPPDKNIDIKKSRYKKLSVFLAEMKTKGIINTSVMKGVESILSIKVR